MYRTFAISLAIITILSACAPAATGIPIVQPPQVPTATLYVAPSKTPREPRHEPTSTPVPPTLLPTIPTFTPIFDASTIVTVTPAAQEECPKENPAAVAAFATPGEYGSYKITRPSEIEDYLNSGGQWDPNWGQLIDLTGDGLNEVVFKSFFAYDIFGCKDGRYDDLLQFAGDFDAELAGTTDLNKNGIPELILFNHVHYGYSDISIFEWDGSKFRSLIDMGPYPFDDTPIDWVTFNYEGYKIIDTNGDGLKEIIAVYNVHEQAKGVLGGYDIARQRPLRDQTIILGWNGQNYVNIKQGTNELPEYRFQAVQDGDEQVRYGNFAAALSFYQAAIFDDRLDWWSREKREYELLVLGTQYEPTPTVYPTPKVDTTEYPQLAAYAYYRIMLLHIAQGYESDARTVYKTLEQKFSNDPYGHPYYEMAAAFWETYQSKHSMYEGCAASIQYAVKHPAILVPLGSEYHGGYSHIYVPADVCPFR